MRIYMHQYNFYEHIYMQDMLSRLIHMHGYKYLKLNKKDFKCFFFISNFIIFHKIIYFLKLILTKYSMHIIDRLG